MNTKFFCHSYGWPALHYASIGGQLSVVEELCARKVNVMHRDQDATTAAYRAKIFGHQAIVDLFNRLTNNHPNLLVPKEVNGNNEKIYSTIVVSKRQNSFEASSNEDQQFIHENNYDSPDDLITRIQCKYSSSDHDKNRKTSLTDHQLKIGGSVYDLPNDKKTTLVSSDDPKKNSDVKKIQALVASQFKDIFLDQDDPYLQPIGSSNAMYGTLGPNNMQNIGFKTLKYLLRSEFQKLKSSYNQSPTTTATTTNSTTDLYFERNIYEEITKGTEMEKESKWVKGGQTIKLGRNQRPPLPPRTSIIERQQQNLSVNDETKFLRNSFNTDFSHASLKLNLIEETQFVKEACFNELIYVLEAGDWQKLARNLPLRNTKNLVEDKIRKIEKQFPKDTTKQARSALNDWNQYYGKNASFAKLIEALKKSGLVEKIKAVEMANQMEFSV